MSESTTMIPKDLEYLLRFKFNYNTEVGPARGGNRIVELEMLRILIEVDVEKEWTFKQLADALHQFVHVANHYTVTDRPPEQLRV